MAGTCMHICKMVVCQSSNTISVKIKRAFYHYKIAVSLSLSLDLCSVYLFTYAPFTLKRFNILHRSHFLVRVFRELTVSVSKYKVGVPLCLFSQTFFLFSLFFLFFCSCFCVHNMRFDISFFFFVHFRFYTIRSLLLSSFIKVKGCVRKIQSLRLIKSRRRRRNKISFT